MNAFLLLIPFLVIRFPLLHHLDPRAVGRAAHFAPMYGREKIAYWVYQLSNAGIFLYLLFLEVRPGRGWTFGAGLAFYLLGLGLCAASAAGFAAPDGSGLNTRGIYRFSRNPMYLAYFVCFLGMALLAHSWRLFGLVAVFQVSAHWVILAEERWCLERFGDAYAAYMKRVRRYL